MNFKDIWMICLRELRGILKQRSVLALVIIVPFLGLYGYTMLMGSMLDTGDNEKEVLAYSVNAPEFMKEALDELEIKPIKADEAEEKRNDIKDAKGDLLIVFPEDFMASPDKLSNVEIWYNSSEISSLNMFTKTSAVLNAFQPVAFTVNLSENTTYDLGDEDSTLKEFVSMLMPMMLVMMITLAIMNLAAESVAGDKERGFLNTMLAAPVSPVSIAMGKMLAVFIAGTISGISGFGGMLLSIPKMTSFMGVENSSISYSAKEYALLFIVTLACVFTTISVMLFISALSNTVKQATTVSPVLMMVVMLCSILSANKSFASKIEDLGTANNIIPEWNAVYNMQKILSLDYSVSDILITAAVSLVFCVIMAVLIGRCFKSEKILNG